MEEQTGDSILQYYKKYPISLTEFDKYKDIAILGLPYLIEKRKVIKSDSLDDCSFLCLLCNRKISSFTVVQHFKTVPHKLAYLKEELPSLYEKYKSIKGCWSTQQLLQFNKDCIELEECSGRGRPAVCLEEEVSEAQEALKGLTSEIVSYICFQVADIEELEKPGTVSAKELEIPETVVAEELEIQETVFAEKLDIHKTADAKELEIPETSVSVKREIAETSISEELYIPETSDILELDIPMIVDENEITFSGEEYPKVMSPKSVPSCDAVNDVDVTYNVDNDEIPTVTMVDVMESFQTPEELEEEILTFYTKVPLCHKVINAVDYAPMMGLPYMVEIQPNSDCKSMKYCTYFCVSCIMDLLPSSIDHHIKSVQHILNFCKRQTPFIYKTFQHASEHTQHREVVNVIIQMEEKYGRGRMAVCAKDNFDQVKKKLEQMTLRTASLITKRVRQGLLVNRKKAKIVHLRWDNFYQEINHAHNPKTTKEPRSVTRENNGTEVDFTSHEVTQAGKMDISDIKSTHLSEAEKLANFRDAEQSLKDKYNNLMTQTEKHPELHPEYHIEWEMFWDEFRLRTNCMYKADHPVAQKEWKDVFHEKSLSKFKKSFAEEMHQLTVFYDVKDIDKMSASNASKDDLNIANVAQETVGMSMVQMAAFIEQECIKIGAHNPSDETVLSIINAVQKHQTKVSNISPTKVFIPSRSMVKLTKDDVQGLFLLYKDLAEETQGSFKEHLNIMSQGRTVDLSFHETIDKLPQSQIANILLSFHKMSPQLESLFKKKLVDHGININSLVEMSSSSESYFHSLSMKEIIHKFEIYKKLPNSERNNFAKYIDKLILNRHKPEAKTFKIHKNLYASIKNSDVLQDMLIYNELPIHKQAQLIDFISKLRGL